MRVMGGTVNNRIKKDLNMEIYVFGVGGFGIMSAMSDEYGI